MISYVSVVKDFANRRKGLCDGKSNQEKENHPKKKKKRVKTKGCESTYSLKNITVAGDKFCAVSVIFLSDTAEH